LQGKLTFGVRPEDLALVTDPAAQQATLPCRITLVEHMGASNLFIVQAGAHQLTIAAPADFYLPPGSNAAILVNPTKVHFFEADSGQNLTL
jgi:ABC-type sugar transport system ATPase subunit